MNSSKKRIVIIGATSVIAEHCARLWVKDEAVDMTLIGRDLEKTQRVAEDLRVRNPASEFSPLKVDFIDPVAITQLIDRIVAECPVHIVLIAHGVLPDQELCQQDLTACHEALCINGLSPVLFAEGFVKHMQAANVGTLAIISSVAGDRGRKSNYIYGASKGLINRYAQGLQHRLANTNVRVVLIKPGPTDTPMTAHLKKQANQFASPDNVAQLIVQGIAKRKSVVYAPVKWMLIMMIIRHLPKFLFNKLDI